MTRLFIAAGLIVVAVVVAFVLRRHQAADAPSQPGWRMPVQLDRKDFARPEAPWLVTVFSSATCSTCAAVVAKARVLACATVAVDEVEVGARREIHNRYRVDAVPMTLIADTDGVVHASFLGPVTATDLWAAVAELRNPGCSPEPDLGHRATDR
jgi:hypothetical protein